METNDKEKKKNSNLTIKIDGKILSRNSIKN